MGLVTLGVDVGQRVDPTAVAVAELDEREQPAPDAARMDLADLAAYLRADRPPAPEEHYLIRRLERLPLGTPYPQVAARVAAIAAGVQARTGDAPTIYLDATGVGTPVVDVLRQAGIAGVLRPVYFTHGDRRTADSKQITLGKAWLVSRLQALLQSGRLHLPATAEARALGEELLDYEIRIDQDANDRYGAFKVGAHDDLVTALGLATQDAPRRVTYLPPIWL